uniref:Chemokine interleukin-8-like domain-containing protein n=1 Tax=Amphiprion percula TaxID=161767 RepID=A0A3P8TQX6_AMPPE
MALWGDAKLFLCILVITCCCTVTVAQMAQDCCLRVANKPIEQPHVADYRKQIAGEGCHISATVLVTRRGVSLCAPDNEQWVNELMKHVDSLKDMCKKRIYKRRRCLGVKYQ